MVLNIYFSVLATRMKAINIDQQTALYLAKGTKTDTVHYEKWY